MTHIQRIDRWHKTKSGLLAFGLAELALCGLLASLAINSGSLWQYSLTFVFFVGFLRNGFLFGRALR